MSYYDPAPWMDASSYNAGFADGQAKAKAEVSEHEHAWQPAGVTEQPYSGGTVTYVWGMCACGEVMLRQWDA